MFRAIVSEYGLPWMINRSLYATKLKMMRILPRTEKFFEKNVEIKRVDIYKSNIETLENYLDQLETSQKNKIIASADDAIEGKILGFSSIKLDYGYPINWHYNPITNQETRKDVKWYNIPDFDPIRGDIKLIWEISRFTHFFNFNRAYMITKDIKYYEAFSNQLKNWLNENEYSYGANYKCGQEATLRMINIIISYSIFEAYGLTNQNDFLNVKKIIHDSYKKVVSNFFYAHKCIKNNHTLSEITGLIIGAWATEDKTKLRQAYELFDNEIQKQFSVDGGYIQNSFNYQRFALQLMEFNFKISETTGIQISNKSKELIKKSTLLLYQMQDQSGDVPNYGSNDGALIFPITSCDYRDFRPVVNTVYYLLEGKRLYPSGLYDEELLWFGNIKNDSISIVSLPKKTTSFPNAGYYTCRFDTGFYMVVLQKLKSRPFQMDQLHFDLWHKGINLFCDSGTYSYATDIGKELVKTSSHNTLQIDNIEQMKIKEPFFVYDWIKRCDVGFDSSFFKGTLVSKNGYRHTRKINKNEKIITIMDEVVGNGEVCTARYHTPCDVEVKGNNIFLKNKGNAIAKITTTGNIKVIKSIRSLYYLKSEEINIINIREGISDNRGNINIEIELL